MMDARSCKSGCSVAAENNKGKLADIKAINSHSGREARTRPSYMDDGRCWHRELDSSPQVLSEG